MKFYFYVLLLIFLAPITSINAANYKDPATFTQEEYRMVYTAKADYDECLQEEALSLVQQSNDPRHVADAAMKSCAIILEKLYTQITLKNYSPDVARKFTWNISNKGSNRLLSNLMRYMATRSAQSSTDTTQETPSEAN